MNGAAAGDYLVRLITQYQWSLSTYVRSLVPDHNDAEEVLQEVNLTILCRGNEFQEGTDFAAWAFAIAYYEVLTYRKRQARDRHLFREEPLHHLAVVAAPMPKPLAHGKRPWKSASTSLPPGSAN